MDNEIKSSIIQHRIVKAKETLKDAQIALENNRLRNALNRVYYSIFYMVSALSVKYDFSTSKHKQLLGWFNKTFVKETLVSLELWNTYKIAFDNRQESDYEDFVEYKIEYVITKVKEAEYFLSEIEKLI